MELLTEEQIEALLADINVAWSVVGGQVLTRVIQASYAECVALVNAFAQIAIAMNHHPEMHLTYDKLEISLTSHDAGGLTQKDFDFAKRVDQHTA